MFINVKTPPIVDILTFIRMIDTTSGSLMQEKSSMVYEHLKFHSQLS